MADYVYSLVSDLHLEHNHTPITGLAQNVIIAGDTTNGLSGVNMIKRLKQMGHTVFAVDGNHEHYTNNKNGRTIIENEALFYAELDQPQKIKVGDHLTILGCNGWYHVEDERAWRGYMNDGRFAGNAYQVNERAAAHANWLKAELTALDGKAIVVTHTAPTTDSLNPYFAGHFSNAWFFNPWLGEVMREHADKIAIWHHGHTHKYADKMVHGVRVVCNPRGYGNENSRWRPLTLHLPDVPA